MAGSLGLQNSLKERLINPFWNYRGSEHGPGVPITFIGFAQTRPDGGEIIRNAKTNKPIDWSDLFSEMGIDPFQLTLNELASRDDDYKFLFGPAIEDAFLVGFTETRSGRPPLWAQLCYSTGIPVAQEGIRRTRFNFTGLPIPTAEGETFPEVRISLAQEEIHWKKRGLTLRLTNEYLRASPLPIVEDYISEIGRIYQHTENSECVRTLLSGDLANGDNAAPVVGIASTSIGIDYSDFSTCWTRGEMIGEDWFTLVSGEAMGNKIGNIDEFKERQVGTPLVQIVNRPEPSNVPRYINSEVPDNQVLIVDTSHAVRQRVFIPLHVRQAERPENWTQGVTIGYSSTFERVGDKACLVLDESLAFADHGFPSWLTVGGVRPYSEAA